MTAALILTLASIAQDDEKKPELSKDPLSKEQIAVYRAVLEQFGKDEDAALNIANRTVPLDLPKEVRREPCMKSLRLESTSKSGAVIHRLDPAIALNKNMVLVDPEAQSKIVEENDPQNLIYGKSRGDQPHTEQQLDDAVSKAFRTGLFAFSEIVFDKRHQHAVVMYSFSCGRLCGAGEMVVLKRSAEKWEISDSCVGWVS